MATVYVPAEFKELAERLTYTKTGRAGKSIFPNYVHLMVFSAMVGYAEDREIEPLDSKRRGSEVYDHIFESERLDGVAFLLALHEFKDGDILRDSRDSECWRVIEGYAAVGMKRINDWLLDSATDVDGVDTILARMKEKAAVQVAASGERLRPDIEF